MVQTFAMAVSNSSKLSAKKPKWTLDYSSRAKADRVELPSPPGYSTQVATVVAEANKEADAGLLLKRSWDVALQPLKQVPMNLFIMYMAGNSISIFPIMMVGMMLVRPIRALFSMSPVFKMLDGQHAIVQRLVYILGQLVGIGLALWKCQSMGLLPTHASDWLDFVEPQKHVEYSDGGVFI